MENDTPGTPMKEKELRSLATCAHCTRKIGETRIPLFYKVVLEKHLLDTGAIQRQQGLTMMLGGHAGLAAAMGPDEDMTKRLDSHTLMVCQECATMPVILAALVEMAGHEVTREAL